MNYHKPPLRRAILAAGAVIATAGPAVLFAAPANAAPTITFTAGVLTINGDAGNNGLVAGQRAYLDAFWERADVEIDGDTELQQAVRFGLFHTLQAGARA